MRTFGSHTLLSLTIVILSGSLFLGACKSYKVKSPSFGEGGGAAPEGEPEGDAGETGDTGGEGDAVDGGTDPGGGGTETGGGTGGTPSTPGAGSVDSVMIWSGSSFLGKISGEGYKIDGKAKTVAIVSKALIGSMATGKTQPISEEQIAEMMVIVMAAKEGKPSKTPEACDKDKMLGQMHIVLVRMGVEEIINNSDVATCEAKRYIDNTSFEKITKYLKTTFPAPIPGTNPTTPT